MAQAWLNNLPSGSIHIWDKLVYSFIRDFKGTYKRAASIEEMRACCQSFKKSIRSYIHGWSVIKNSTEGIFEERAIDAFNGGVTRCELREELGCIKPKTIDHLMDITNHLADGEDAIHNNQTHSNDKDDLGRGHDHWGKRRMRVYDDREEINMVMAGYTNRWDDGNRNSGYRSGIYRDDGNTMESWQCLMDAQLT